MRVGIIQSSYIPWRGYFDFINSVDLFVFYDDVQYTPQNWRNRNLIKTPNGLQWLTVPVHHDKLSQKINETRISSNQGWKQKHLRSISQNYSKSSYFSAYINEFSAILNSDYETLSDLNKKLIQWLMTCLSIRTPIIDSTSFNLNGKSTQRIIKLLETVGADTYLSGPSASSYLDLNLFREAGISLEYKTYDYAPYPQLHGDFAPSVSVLDLMFCMGDKAKDYIKSQSPDTIVLACGDKFGNN